MRLKIVVLCLAAACLAAADGQGLGVATFDDDKPGLPPQGFILAAMRQPAAGTWLVRRQGTQGYLVHEADPAAAGYALAIRADATPQDLVASVRMRLAGGTKTGGLVWHYLNEKNYFAAILNLARGEVSLYRMKDGNRIRTEFQDDLDLDADAWHTMKVEHVGNATRVSLGGIRVLSDEHKRNEGAGGPGRVGLLASGDAQIWYDDLRIEAAKRSR